MHFLLKFLRGFWGNLISKKRRREKKNSSCAVPTTCKRRKHVVCLRAADGRSSRSRVPEPSSNPFPSLSTFLSLLLSGAKCHAFLPRPWSWCPRPCQAGTDTDIRGNPSMLAAGGLSFPFWHWQIQKLRLRGPAPLAQSLVLNSLLSLGLRGKGLAIVLRSPPCCAPQQLSGTVGDP